MQAPSQHVEEVLSDLLSGEGIIPEGTIGLILERGARPDYFWDFNNPKVSIPSSGMDQPFWPLGLLKSREIYGAFGRQNEAFSGVTSK